MDSIERRLRLHEHFSSHRIGIVKRPTKLGKGFTVGEGFGGFLHFVNLGSHNVT